MSNMSPGLTFQERVVTAFLLVPWLPLLIAYPVTLSKNFQLFGWGTPYHHLLLCLVIAGITYVLEVIVLVPAWLWMLRNRKVSLLRILSFAVLIAFALGVIFFRLLFGPDIFRTIVELKWLLLLICLIGGAEALVFWLIVRPDIRGRPDGR
jgi:hypothetical protein